MVCVCVDMSEYINYSKLKAFVHMFRQAVNLGTGY